MARILAKLSLQQRVPLLIGLGLLLILASFAALSLHAVEESRQRALQERLLMAELAAHHIDLSVGEALRVLERTAALPEVNLTDGDEGPERGVLTYLRERGGPFSNSLFFLDHKGNTVASLPEGQQIILKAHDAGQQQIDHTLVTGTASVSGLQCSKTARVPIVCLTVPVRDESGNVIGLLGGSLELTDPSIAGFVGNLQLGNTGYAQIVDQGGAVLGGTDAAEPIEVHSTRFAALIDEQRAVVTACHSCHEAAGGPAVRQDIVAFAPLSTAPWGVTINQAEAEVFAPATMLLQRALALSAFAVLGALALAWLGVRAIVKPVSTLTVAAERIAAGDLTEAVRVGGRDELGRLASAFETMRLRLWDSRVRIEGWNRELEEAVACRTRELEQSREALCRLNDELQRQEVARGRLLDKVISAQEEERRRIARELHDQTSQTLAALSVGLDAALTDPRADPEALRQRLTTLKPLVLDTLEGVHNLIFDLRPSLLDDLGLVAALQWYAENRLAGLGIEYHVEVAGEEQRLLPQVETAVFRVVQEAITNVTKHAEADTVEIRLVYHQDRFEADVTDDGRGFDVEAEAGPAGVGHGYGLLGMHERIDLLGGILHIASRPGAGTRVAVAVPLAPEGKEVPVG